jgi:diguanylate cyclase (GGDEF)-like protein/PAS domain S-box-containing protein
MLHVGTDALEQALALAGSAEGGEDAFLRAALEAARVGTWRIDMIDRLSNWDAVTSALFGHPPFPQLHKAPLAVVHADDVEATARNLQTCFDEGCEQDVEFRVVTAAGEVRWIRALARPLRTGRERRWVGGIVMDVTERRRAGDALAESRRQLATLIGNLPGIAYRCGAAAPWWFDYISEAAEELTGWPREAWMAREIAWAEIVGPEDAPALLAAVDAAVASRQPFTHTYRIRHRSGALRWVREQGQAVYGPDGEAVAIEGFIGDVTEQKILEEALRESTARAHGILDSVPQIIWVANSEGQCEYLSPQWGAFTGREVALDLGDAWAGALHPDDRAATWEAWGTSLATGETFDVEFRLRGGDGLYRWTLSRAIPSRNAAGEVVRWYGTCTDVHERVLAEQALAETEAVNRSILEASPDCILLLDLEGRVLFVNRLGPEALGLDGPQAILGRRWSELLAPEAARDAAKAVAKGKRGERSHVTLAHRAGNGEPRWFDSVATPVFDEAGHPVRLVVVSRDITHQKQSEEKVRWVANHDTLTHLPNRLLFQERLDALVAAGPDKGCFALLLLDIDEFKRVNDTLGHDAGDALLCAFAERLKETARADDLVARLGGDEFAVILNGVRGEAEVTTAVEALMSALRRPWVHGGMVLDCDASIGASLFPLDGASRAELMKHADIALYVAKAAGRGNLKLFQPAMRAEMQNRISMLALARDAIEKKWITPFYQPKIDLATGEVSGFEALLRWHHPGKGFQSPDTIAAAFEDLTIATGLSDRMIEGVIADMRGWLERGIAFGHVAINAAAAEFRGGDFAERLLERLAAAEVPAHFVQLEVTETVFLGRGAECVERTLKTLSAAGMTIALDDFGTGYASLSHLKQFPVDLLKIDKSFVRDLNVTPDAAAIIRAVIHLGHSLDVRIVAEGIETLAQQASLVAQGCDFGQGYLYSPAVPAAEVPAILALAREAPDRRRA